MNGKMFADLLLAELVILFLSCFLGLKGFLTVLVLEIFYTLCWIVRHS